MRVEPENVGEIWRGAKAAILDRHPELAYEGEARAGEFAAAQVFNWFHEDWATLRESVTRSFQAGELKRNDPHLETFRRLMEWTPYHELRDISGSRTFLRDIDHPIVLEDSVAPAHLLVEKNYWRTGRIEDLEKVEDVREIWNGIRSEFRGRTRGREGSLYVNHQGALMIKTAFEILDLRSIGQFGGITCHLNDAQKTVEFFQRESNNWPGDAGKNFRDLANAFEEGIADALANGKNAVGIVDTTAIGNDESSTITYAKQVRRHEAFHVWEYSTNTVDAVLLTEEQIIADPDYHIPDIMLAEYYEEMTPETVVSEATAFIASGDYESAGFEDKERALAYLGRYLSQVVEDYGLDVLDGLRMVHPDTREVIDHVRSIAIDIGGPQERPEEGTGPGGATPRSRRAAQALEGSLERKWSGGDEGDQRGRGKEPEPAGFSAAGIEARESPTYQIFSSNEEGLATNSYGAPSASFAAALQRIADLEKNDPAGTRPWKDLAHNAGEIAREAIAKIDPTQTGKDKEQISALEKIAALALVDSSGKMYSWKELASGAIETARQTLTDASASIEMIDRSIEPRIEPQKVSPTQGLGW